MWDELPEDVRAELLDPDYDTRTHGKKATYATGCRGPLCAKADRDAQNQKYRDDHEGEVKEYQPRPERALDVRLDFYMQWHWIERDAIGRGKPALPYYHAAGITK